MPAQKKLHPDQVSWLNEFKAAELRRLEAKNPEDAERHRAAAMAALDRLGEVTERLNPKTEKQEESNARRNIDNEGQLSKLIGEGELKFTNQMFGKARRKNRGPAVSAPLPSARRPDTPPKTPR